MKRFIVVMVIAIVTITSVFAVGPQLSFSVNSKVEAQDLSMDGFFDVIGNDGSIKGETVDKTSFDISKEDISVEFYLSVIELPNIQGRKYTFEICAEPFACSSTGLEQDESLVSITSAKYGKGYASSATPSGNEVSFSITADYFRENHKVNDAFADISILWKADTSLMVDSTDGNVYTADVYVYITSDGNDPT